MATRVLLGIALGVGLGGAALADTPLSAIDWLSDRVTAPPQPATVLRDQGDIATNALPNAVTTMPLDAPDANRIGLEAPQAVGLPETLWAGASEPTLLRLFAQIQPHDIPALRALIRDMLTVSAQPPIGADPAGALFLARIDALIQMGDLDRASRMLVLAGQDDAKHFRRWFDIALLTGAENHACARMRALPDITPTYPARIFCLARGGDWSAAALTLDTAQTLGVVSPAEDALLLRFLDDITDLDDTDIAVPSPLTPLDFALFEAIGTPLDTTTLPLAYAHADLRDNTGWKSRLEAAERLARAGAIPPSQLWHSYKEREPAASGGVWDRVDALQSLLAALPHSDASDAAELLPDAWQIMKEAGLGHAFAAAYGVQILRLPLTAAAADIATEIALLSPARPLAAEKGSAKTLFLRGLAQGRPDPSAATSPLEHAIADGFSAGPPAQSAALLTQNRTGEAIFEAIALITDGAAGNYDQLRDGLALLRAAGLADRAISTALELLILDLRS